MHTRETVSSILGGRRGSGCFSWHVGYVTVALSTSSGARLQASCDYPTYLAICKVDNGRLEPSMDNFLALAFTVLILGAHSWCCLKRNLFPQCRSDSDHLRYIWHTWSLGVLPVARKPLNGTEEESRDCLGTVEASGRGSGRATGIAPLCQLPALPHRDTAFL